MLLIDSEVSRALGRIKQTVVKIGAKTCKECEEKIPEARCKLGFNLCVACAEELERRKSLFAE